MNKRTTPPLKHYSIITYSIVGIYVHYAVHNPLSSTLYPLSPSLRAIYTISSFPHLLSPIPNPQSPTFYSLSPCRALYPLSLTPFSFSLVPCPFSLLASSPFPLPLCPKDSPPARR